MWFGGPPALVFALGAVFTAVGTGHKPAQAALLPSLADDPRQLAASNAVWSAVDSIGFLRGARWRRRADRAGGAEFALAATAAAFLLAALALAGIPADRRPHRCRAHRARQRSPRASAPSRADRRLRLVVGVLGVSTLVEGAIDVLVVLVALELLDLGAAGVGWLNSAWGLGGVIGGAGAVMLMARGRNATGLVLGSLLVGVPLLALTRGAGDCGVAALGLIVLGVGYAVIEVAGLTLVQRLASDAVLARAFGVVEGTYWLTTGLGSLLAPALVLRVRAARRAARRSARRCPLLVLARWRALARAWRRPRRCPSASTGSCAGSRMFAPLPIMQLEELARRVSHVAARRAGETIIREGEPGDRFYVIADGAVAVPSTAASGAPRSPATASARSPCCATCRARRPWSRATDVELLALEREEFLAAITGDHRALAAGHDLVEAARRWCQAG